MPDPRARVVFVDRDLKQKVCPTITMWNRLEGRPRGEDFSRSLRAEVRDALWMLAKQVQMGELRGADAGSPIFAKLRVRMARLDQYGLPGHARQVLPSTLPLEAVVERRPIPTRQGGQGTALDLRLQMGRMWLKLVATVDDAGPYFVEKYPIRLPVPETAEHARVCAHHEVWSQYAAVAGRAMDGWELHNYLVANPDHHSYDGIRGIPAHMHGALEDRERKFVDWYRTLYLQPAASEDAWRSGYLEYGFESSAPWDGGERVYRADEYSLGHLDWYSLDLDSSGVVTSEPREVLAEEPAERLATSFIPKAIVFDGMPNTRWWAFEDGQTNFGQIRPDTTDLAKLLLVEFGLVYANDWFIFPVTLDVGTVAQIEGLAVTNVFGERLWIESAGKATGQEWQRWGMFTTTVGGGSSESCDMSLLIPASSSKVQTGAPLEVVSLVRDEVGNMVWGIEETVLLPDGTSARGSERARELHSYLQRLVDVEAATRSEPPADEGSQAAIRYQLMNAVGENWIPFIPVHVDGDSRSIQLQRAAMPRILEGNHVVPDKVRPCTSILRVGLDEQTPRPYFLHEEEVPRSGVRVAQCFQRARWYDGRTVVWLATTKTSGRGEAASGLAFDQIIPAD